MEGECVMSYAKLKNGEIVKVWSDNEEEKTINYYPIDEDFDPEFTITSECPHSDIVKRYSSLLELSEEDYNKMLNSSKIDIKKDNLSYPVSDMYDFISDPDFKMDCLIDQIEYER